MSGLEPWAAHHGITEPFRSLRAGAHTRADSLPAHTDLGCQHAVLAESQELGHVVLHGEHQRGVALGRLAVERGAGLQELVHDAEVPKVGGEHHRRHAVVVRMVDLKVVELRIDHELEHVEAVDRRSLRNNSKPRSTRGDGQRGAAA